MSAVLLPHQQRVVAQKNELDAKITELYEFMHSNTFYNLERVEQDLRRMQLVAMQQYSRILGELIALFHRTGVTHD